ncbi:DNA primase DnaG [Halorussus sp. MSC15.2]|uniref:DNA primase DnaG n=1 Tax=Halorussus sp. MSC15.2 TaxID=2283638 RepID=UPI0013D2413E|nr:DNA primase DnaG [Halorussus sp. MSC15.2]NEU56000.1 DNA primase [Halorussus sp. MSC15.2]
MDDTAKYVIHADITADGVVERSDVVGAVFGQTEGLLGDDLDLRDLQQSSKLGRIDVDIDSENGQSFGTITIASSLDKVETSILAAALETISRVGPCRATVSVASIEDVRAAKRRKVVERAKQLLSDSFDEDVMTSREILEEVRQSVRVEDIVEYEGLPAGPRVADSDAIIVVEGRADVLNLLKYGVKNAVAVEGTNVPNAVAELTQNRTVTVFLDGDRGGDLIRKELAQVGDIDYVAFAPSNKSVEDLARHEVMSALRSKRSFEESMNDESSPDSDATDSGATDLDSTDRDPTPPESSANEAGPAATDGSARPAPESDETAGPDGPVTPAPETAGPGAGAESADSASPDAATESTETGPAEAPEVTDDADEPTGESTIDPAVRTASASETGDSDPSEGDAAEEDSESGPVTLRGHVETVVDAETGTARLLDESFETVAEVAAENAFDAVESAEEAPYAVVVDGTLEQRVLDVSAQRGVRQVVARDLGEFVKQPADVRVQTADKF